ncbi:glycosyltransferase [Ramlibacter sp. PS4R-6]|uniref:glycosyltransferase n=1 Tax=Ramlibacter sp. PS4R-6 TaxID=3133438 RepID=UPI00309618F2
MPVLQSLVVFSHRRWSGFYQRPQHLLTRLARRWPVVYVEEPVPGSDADRLEVFEPAAGVQVWRPHVTGAAEGFHDEHLPVLKQLVADAVRERGIRDAWLWFYTPMALPLAGELRPRGIVYDCMDELSHLRDAPGQLVQRENALFKVADLVFTGGPSIHKAKRSRHPDVHCFPGSVDAAHFERIGGEHPLHADIPRPRIGYSGVIDRRINLVLLDAIAKARPEWNFVMVGPLAGIDAAALPRPDNIHWLGPQSWDDLPKFIKGWDVCLMPFALNEATRSISPNKTLEYMACGRPAVSTSIRDIVEPYGHVLRIADTPEGFIADIEMLLARPREEQERHARELKAIAARTSWDGTAGAIAELIAQADELVGAGAQIATPQSRPIDMPAMPLPRVDSGAQRAAAAG